MIKIVSVPDEDCTLDMVGNPHDLCVEMAIALEHFTERILERAAAPAEAARQISVLFTGAIGDALEKVKEAEA